MPITQRTIESILNNHMVRGTWYHINEIQELIKKHYRLSPDDLKPHTNTRPTSYPVWKHRLQSFLSNMKNKGKIIHNEKNHSYLLP